MVSSRRCLPARHRWIRDKEGLVCRRCGATRRRKALLCYVGLHNWTTFGNGDSRYLACRWCGHYGGDPGTFNWVPDRDRFR